MTYYTHISGGVLAGAIITGAAIPDNTHTALILGGAMIGSLLPDIDHTKSKISRSSLATSVIAQATRLFTKHRGIIHTPIFILFVWVLAYLISAFMSASAQEYFKLFVSGIVPGMLSHLILDTLNPGGIMWIFPINQNYYHIGGIKTGSIFETLVTIALISVIALEYGVI